MSTTALTFGTINAALNSNVGLFADRAEATIIAAGFTIADGTDNTLIISAVVTTPELATAQLVIPVADWVTQMNTAIRSLPLLRHGLVAQVNLDDCAMELSDAVRAVYKHSFADDPAAQLAIITEMVRWQLDGLRPDIALWAALNGALGLCGLPSLDSGEWEALAARELL